MIRRQTFSSRPKTSTSSKITITPPTIWPSLVLNKYVLKLTNTLSLSPFVISVRLVAFRFLAASSSKNRGWESSPMSAFLVSYLENQPNGSDSGVSGTERSKEKKKKKRFKRYKSANIVLGLEGKISARLQVHTFAFHSSIGIIPDEWCL